MPISSENFSLSAVVGRKAVVTGEGFTEDTTKAFTV
jgi:hypothetical protein